jgi:hypothetical protein
VIEGSDERRAAPASRGIQDLARQVTEPPRRPIAPGLRLRGGHDDDLLRSKREPRQRRRQVMRLRHQADRAIERAATHFLDEIGGPMRADLQANAGELLPQRIERRGQDHVAETMGHAGPEITDRVCGLRPTRLQFRHGRQNPSAMLEDVASERRKNRRLHRPIEERRIAKLGLEILDAPGGRRLGEIEADGGTVYGAGFGNRDKSLDSLEVHENGE